MAAENGAQRRRRVRVLLLKGMVAWMETTMFKMPGRHLIYRVLFIRRFTDRSRVMRYDTTESTLELFFRLLRLSMPLFRCFHSATFLRYALTSRPYAPSATFDECRHVGADAHLHASRQLMISGCRRGRPHLPPASLPFHQQ